MSLKLSALSMLFMPFAMASSTDRRELSGS